MADAHETHPADSQPALPQRTDAPERAPAPFSLFSWMRRDPGPRPAPRPEEEPGPGTGKPDPLE
jgi:hypothetical protein